MKTATEDESNFLFQKTGDVISLANVTDSLNINDTLIVNSSSGRVGVGIGSPSAKLEASNSTQGLTFDAALGDNDGPLINSTASTNVSYPSGHENL